MTAAIEFADALANAGLGTPPIEADGKIHRFHVAGDRAGSRNGWCVLHADGDRSHGAYGSHRTGERFTYRSQSARAMTPADRAAIDRQRREAARARTIAYEAAATEAARIFDQCRPADRDHPYLTRKGIGRHGARQMGDRLVLPMRDAAGKLWTAQYIGADGEKRFFPGGRITGCYFAIGRLADRLYLCEGFATAATCAELSQSATACAFSAGNLQAVAVALRAKYPAIQIVIVADNDTETAERIGRNPGVTFATRAAAAVGAGLVIPGSIATCQT